MYFGKFNFAKYFVEHNLIGIFQILLRFRHKMTSKSKSTHKTNCLNFKTLKVSYQPFVVAVGQIPTDFYVIIDAKY